jgi:transcriptional regulator with XRE-family HTH domain
MKNGVALKGGEPPPLNLGVLGRRIERARLEQGKSIEDLAKEAQVNKNTIVRLEKGRGSKGTQLPVLNKVCAKLRISLQEIIGEKLREGEDYAVTRHRSERASTVGTLRVKRVSRQSRERIAGAGIMIGDLNYQLPRGSLRAVVLEIKAPKDRRGELRTHSGEELLFCLTGTVGVVIGGVNVVLNKGDAVFFWGTEPHAYYNADEHKDQAVALSVYVAPDKRTLAETRRVLHERTRKEQRKAEKTSSAEA